MTNVKVTIQKTVNRTMSLKDETTAGELKQKLEAAGFDLASCCTVVQHAGYDIPLTSMSDEDIITEGDHIFFLASDDYDAVAEDQKFREARSKEAEEEFEKIFGEGDPVVGFLENLLKELKRK